MVWVLKINENGSVSKLKWPIQPSAVRAGIACPKTQSKLFSGKRILPLRTKRQHYPRSDTTPNTGHLPYVSQLILVEVLLNLLPVICLCQRKHQQYTCFLRIQFLRSNKLIFIVIHFCIKSGRTCRNTAGANDQNPLFTRFFQHREQVLMNVAVSHTGMHNTLIPPVP